MQQRQFVVVVVVVHSCELCTVQMGKTRDIWSFRSRYSEGKNSQGSVYLVSGIQTIHCFAASGRWELQKDRGNWKWTWTNITFHKMTYKWAQPSSYKFKNWNMMAPEVLLPWTDRWIACIATDTDVMLVLNWHIVHICLYASKTH